MPPSLSVREELCGASQVNLDQNAAASQRGRTFSEPSNDDETSCNRIALTLKQGEIQGLKKLRHKHIIKVAGCYTVEGRLRGLLKPMTPYNLATFLEDMERLRKQVESKDATTIIAGRIKGLFPEPLHTSPDTSYAFGKNADLHDVHHTAVSRLSQCYGCIASAVSYLHGQNIQLNVITPSNILLSRDGLWLAGFDTLTDFSMPSPSRKVAGERESSKYSAPEVAVYDLGGHSSNIFSLGCIFLEMTVVCSSLPLGHLSNLLTDGDSSYQANIKNLEQWFAPLQKDPPARLRHLVYEIREMLQMEPEARPTAADLTCTIPGISQIVPANRNVDFPPLYGPCCAPPPMPPCDHAVEIDRLKSQHLALKNVFSAQFERHGTDFLFLPREYEAEKERLRAEIVALKNLAVAKDEWFNAYLKTSLSDSPGEEPESIPASPC